MECAECQKFFPMIFPYRYFEIPWSFHDFAFFFKFHDFSRSGKCIFHFPGYPWFSRPLGTLSKLHCRVSLPLATIFLFFLRDPPPLNYFVDFFNATALGRTPTSGLMGRSQLFFTCHKKKNKKKRKHKYLCFRWPLTCLGGSSAGSRKISKSIGWYFLNITVETAKFLSSLSTFSLKSCGKLAMSDHFFILLKNWSKLQWKKQTKHRNSWQNERERHFMIIEFTA